MLDDVCYSVLKTGIILRCPKHGEQLARQIAPDLAFEDIEEKFLISNDSLKIESLLGRGSFGSVFAGSLLVKSNSVKVAVKVLETINSSNQIESQTRTASSWNYRKSVRLAAKAYTVTRQEIAIISALKHENIVSMVGLSVQPLAIILELAVLGNLKDILGDYKSNACKLNPFVVQRVSSQVADALVYLHANRIIYRDLKADNVLVWKFPKPNQSFSSNKSSSDPSNNSVYIKLADYSISRCVLPTGTKGFAGTEGFMAPRICSIK